MQEDEDSGDFVSKSARKRAATAAQALGTKLTTLKDSELEALQLPERLHEAILLAKRITSRGGLARQRQYIGKLMRDIDLAPIEAALGQQSRQSALQAEQHKRIETWRARLLTEGPRALDELQKWCPDADCKSLQALVDKATGSRIDPASREAASRELFRSLRSLLQASS